MAIIRYFHVRKCSNCYNIIIWILNYLATLAVRNLFISAKRFKVLLNAASNRSKKRISMYFHVKATRTNKGGERIVSLNQKILR